MKTRYWLASVMALLAVLMAQTVSAGKGNGQGQPTPPPNGQYSGTLSGSLAVCLDPTDFMEEPCSTSGTLVIPITVVSNEVVTALNGTSCSSAVEVDSDFVPDASQPMVTTNEHSTSTVTNFDPATDSGDVSFTTYFGGTCNGASFDSTGATQVSSGTLHFVVSEKGKRLDFIVTALQNPNKSIGDFSLTGVNRLQLATSSSDEQ